MVAEVTQRRSPWGKDPILLRRSSGQCVDKPAGGKLFGAGRGQIHGRIPPNRNRIMQQALPQMWLRPCEQDSGTALSPVRGKGFKHLQPKCQQHSQWPFHELWSRRCDQDLAKSSSPVRGGGDTRKASWSDGLMPASCALSAEGVVYRSNQNFRVPCGEP